MKYHCIKIFGSKRLINTRYTKVFKTLSSFEKWIGKNTGFVIAMTFHNGETVVYRYRYKNGIRRKVGEVLTDYDFRWSGLELV
jgi:hypothetical protein